MKISIIITMIITVLLEYLIFNIITVEVNIYKGDKIVLRKKILNLLVINEINFGKDEFELIINEKKEPYTANDEEYPLDIDWNTFEIAIEHLKKMKKYRMFVSDNKNEVEKIKLIFENSFE